MKLSFCKSENWKGNFNYWTAGRQGCKGVWGWCSQMQAQPFTTGLAWDVGQPAYKVDNENCLQMKISRNGSGIVLNDRDCKDRFVFACKVVWSFLRWREAIKKSDLVQLNNINATSWFSKNVYETSKILWIQLICRFIS
jgi:hypothetical protein